MKATRFFNYMLTVAVVLGLGMSVTSCKSDDDDNGNGNDSAMTQDEVDPTDNDEARTAFRWLCILTNGEDFDQNWQKKTWEPTVGVASTDNDATRIIVVDNLDDAREEFSKLADKDVSEIGTKLTINGGAAGSMTWEQSAEGAQNLASVTVNVPVIPHLQKIVYCTEEQVGDNGTSMKGTAYYRFGDVIRDSQGYYWVCVRPAFAPRNKKECSAKGDSHWINIFNGSESGGGKPMPSANVKTKWNNLKKYNYQTIKLPTGLKYDIDHIGNLLDLIWALLNPNDYKDCVLKRNWPALGGFPYEYNGINIVEQVCDLWGEPYNGYTIWQILFNHTYAEMKGLKKIIFYYQGYSWPSGETGHVWGRSSTSYFMRGESDKESINFVKDGFDVTYYAQCNDEMVYTSRFSKGGVGRWVVRYAKGQDLVENGKYSYYSKIPGATDIYRYNQEMHITAGANTPAQMEDDLK